MDAFEFMALSDYEQTKDPTLVNVINSVQNSIKANPYSAGDRFTGPMKMFRHAKVNQNYMILYVICKEAKSLTGQKWIKAKKNHDSQFRACPKYCNVICIDQKENLVIFFRVMKHSEENRVFGSRN